MDKLNLFFTKIKELSFIQRIFSWGVIRSLSYDAFEEFKSLSKKISSENLSKDEKNNKITQLSTINDSLKEKNVDFEKREIKKDNLIETQTNKISELSKEVSSLNTKITEFETSKGENDKKYENSVAQLNQIKENLDSERVRINEEKAQEQVDRFEKMKTLWNEHELNVQQKIKVICNTHTVTYVEKVPFKGNPDNTIEISNEYIIFDAKSPSNDDLSNFPKYIKAQTDNVKKYAKQENVKRDIFLVIPSNTIDKIAQLSFNMGDYNVYVITIDSLEPIILSLKKIEEYEFVDQLSPDERDNICRVIGKFAHTTKRKIQIDQFFANQFIELLVKCKSDLPEDILKQVIEFEKAEKLNPPTEKRAKQILTQDLIDKNISINSEAKIREIDIPKSFDDLKKLD